MADSSAARQRWELENSVQHSNEPTDALYVYSQPEQTALQQQKPWRADPHHFKQCVRLGHGLPCTLHAEGWGRCTRGGTVRVRIDVDTCSAA